MVIKKVKNVLLLFHNEEKGSYMVEMALVLVGVALTVFMAASNLSTEGIIPQYEAITDEVKGVAVPDLTP